MAFDRSATPFEVADVTLAGGRPGVTAVQSVSRSAQTAVLALEREEQGTSTSRSAADARPVARGHMPIGRPA